MASFSVGLDRRPGKPGALYNMALAGTSQNRELLVGAWPGTGLDKLRLSCWCGLKPDRVFNGSRVEVRTAGHQVLKLIPAARLERGKVQRGRNRGDRESWRTWAHVRAGLVPGDATIYVQHDWEVGRLMSEAGKLVIEFNPAYMTRGDWDFIRALLQACEVWTLYVERVDYRMDYPVPRGLLLLDDRQREADQFGVGPAGPQTERTGFRRGATIQFQLYDKRAERRARAGQELGEDMTRFELTVNGAADGSELRLVDLPAMVWPAGDVTVRSFVFDPATIYDAEFAWAALACRGNGLKTVLSVAKRLGWSMRRREQFLGCIVPEVQPSPSAVWGRCFAADAARVVGLLVDDAGQVRAGDAESLRHDPVIDWGNLGDFADAASSERPPSEPRSSGGEVDAGGVP